MIKPVFSTVACPELPTEQVFALAGKSGFVGVEWRSFGDGSREFANDPALTAPEKIRAWADRAGLINAQLATSCRFDAPVSPPVLGLVIGDQDRSVREAKRAIDLAASIECPLVRVFAFELPSNERRVAAELRVVDRLRKVVDHAHRTGVRVALENGGSYAGAGELKALLDQIDNPLLGACYNLAVGAARGDSPVGAVETLGGRLFSVRVKDLRAGRPCPLGDGELDVNGLVGALVRAGFDGPVVYEWDRAWIAGLEPAEKVLPVAAQRLFAALAGAGAGQPMRHPAAAR